MPFVTEYSIFIIPEEHENNKKEERRARNASYERERRQAASEAKSELAEATGCDASSSLAEIIATTINLIQAAGKLEPCENVEAKRRNTQKLIDQVKNAQQRVDNAQSSGRKRKNSVTTDEKHNKKPKN